MKKTASAAPSGGAAIGEIKAGGKEHITPVADDQNWRSYISNELKCAEIWHQDWGFLQSNGEAPPDKVPTKDEKIKQLEEELDKLKHKKLRTTNHMYGKGETLEMFPLKHLNIRKNEDLKPVDRKPPKK